LVSDIVDSTAGRLWLNPVKIIINPGGRSKAYPGTGGKERKMTSLAMEQPLVSVLFLET
jgi:hypothetical protein